MSPHSGKKTARQSTNTWHAETLKYVKRKKPDYPNMLVGRKNKSLNNYKKRYAIPSLNFWNPPNGEVSYM